MPSDVLITPASSKIDFTDGANSTKRLNISGTAFSFNSNLNVLSSTSLGSAFKAEGVNGTLFEVIDDLSNSLMSVNTIGGLPVFEVFANNSIIAGQYGVNDFVISGNKVGIGLANPINKLSVSGAVSIGSSYNVAAPSNGLIVQGDVGIGVTSFNYSNANRANLEMYGATDSLIALRSSSGNSYIQKYINDLYINNVTNGALAFFNNGSERWRITSAGVLQSNADQTIQTSTGVLTLATAAGNGNIILSPHGTGNVGIGTASPLTKLDVRSGSITAGTNTSTAGTTIIAGYYTAGALTVLGTEQSSGGPVLGYAVTPSTSGTGAFLSATSIAIPRSAYTQDGGTHRWYIGASQTVAIGSAVTASEVMRINSSGNVGVGTTTVSYKLHVQGDIYARSAVINISGDLNALRGNVTTMGYNLTNSPSGAGWITVNTSQNFLSSGDILSQLAYDNYNQQKLFTRHSSNYGATWSAWKTIINSDALSGTTNYVPKFTGTNSIGNSLIFDNGTNVAVGSNAVAYGRLQISATGTSPSLSSTNPTDVSLIISNSDIAYGAMFATYGDGKGALQQRRTNAATYYDFSLQPHGGNVGIGVASPRVLLDLAKANNVGQVLLIGETGANIRVGFGLAPSNAGMRIFSLNHISDGLIEFGGISSSDGSTWSRNHRLGLAGGNSFFNEQGGNVGIGTTNPSSSLHVSKAGNTSGGTILMGLSNDGAAKWSYLVSTQYNSSSNAKGFSLIGGYTDASSNVVSIGGSIYEANPATELQFYTHTAVTHATGGTRRMTINTNGNVGIGYTNPAYLLDVNGVARINGNFNITGGGDLGIFDSDGTGTFYSYMDAGVGYIRIDDGSSANGKLDINNSLLYIQQAGGNVGVGTNNPNNKLHVNGSVSIGSGYNTAAPTNGLLVQGNVGIGVTNPSTYSSQLAIETSQTRAIMAFNTALADAGTLYGLGFGYAMSNYNSAYISFYKVGNSSISNRLSFSLWNQNDILNINGAGNVGIGITVPLAQLHINEATSGAAALRVDGTNGTLFSVIDDLSDSLMSVNNSAGLPVLEVFADDRVVMGQYGTNDLVVRNNKVGVGTVNPGTSLEIYATPATSTTLRQMLIINTDFGSASGTGFGGSIVFRGRTAGNLLRDNAQITAYNEDIGDNGYALGFFTRPNDTLGMVQRMTIARGGNVGIGTVSPATLLHVDTAGADARIRVSAGTNTVQGGMIANTNGLVYAGSITNHGFSLRTNDTDRVRIDTSGNVGIGTTTGTFTLNVYNNADVWHARFGGITGEVRIGGQTNSGAVIQAFVPGSGTFRDLYIQRDGGNVGIGTNSPGALLQIGTGTPTATTGGIQFGGDTSARLYRTGAGIITCPGTISSNLIGSLLFNEVALNSPADSGGTWTTGNGSEWGDPKFKTAFNQYRYADGNGPYVQYNVPAGYDTCFISQLQWDTGGYADCHGVQADGDLVFLRRINTRQLVENSNHGNTIQHDGETVTCVGTGLSNYSSIRITNRSGRIHMTGIAWQKTSNLNFEGTGMVHPAQISHQGSGSGLNADLLDGYNADSANTASTIVLRDASGNFTAGTITASLTGNVTGNAATASLATTSDRLTSRDNRTISSNEDDAFRLRFGFTSWANNDSSPYADYLHLRSYSDASGGNDNLVMFRKDAIGMRIYQAGFGTSVAYSSFKDVAFTDQSFFIGTTSVAINRASAALTLNGVNVSGTSANVTGTVAIANGGTGTTTAQLAINALAGAVTNAQYLRGNGTNVVMSAIQAADVPTLNQNTTGSSTFVASLGVLNYDNDRTTKRAGLSHYTGYSTGTNRPTTYDYTLQVTNGTSGWEISMDWIATTGPAIYARSLRDCCQNWSSWVRILDSANYSFAANMNQNVRTTDGVTFAGITGNGQLNINHSTPTAVARLWSGGSTVWSLGVGDASGSYFNISADFGSFTINKTNGYVGIGTTSQTTRLQLGSGTPTASADGIQFGGDTSARLYRSSSGVVSASNSFSALGGFVYASNYLQTGNNLIYPASFSATQRLEVGNAAQNAWITGISIAPGGNVVVAGTLTESSSIRYKENIETISAPILSKLNKIRPVTYNKKDNPKHIEYGIIAEELNELFPEFVNKNDKGEVESVNYSRLTVILIKAVKELQEEVEKLKNK